MVIDVEWRVANSSRLRTLPKSWWLRIAEIQSNMDPIEPDCGGSYYSYRGKINLRFSDVGSDDFEGSEYMPYR